MKTALQFDSDLNLINKKPSPLSKIISKCLQQVSNDLSLDDADSFKVVLLDDNRIRIDYSSQNGLREGYTFRDI